MPAEKTNRASNRRAEHNKNTRSGMRTLVRKADGLIEAGNVEEAEGAVQTALSALDKAAQKGIIHGNAADRSKSRLTVRLNKAKTAKA